MSHEANLIAIQIAVQAREPVFLWGAPGTGKTATVEDFTEIIKEPIWVVILSVREPSDQGGLPVITPDGVRMEPPMWAKQLAKTGHGVVFFDEFNTAPPTTQSSALRLIHGGWAGDLKLPTETSFIAAGNPPGASSGTYELTPAIANRWVHFDWKPEPIGWCTAMVSGWPKAAPPRLGKNWEGLIAASNANFASFIRARPNLLDDMPSDPGECGRAWKSRRMWTVAARLAAAAGSVGHNLKSDVARKLIAGCVGEPAQREFSSWFENLDLLDPELYLADPYGTQLPKRQDQVVATLDGIVSACLQEGHKRDAYVARHEAAWQVVARVATKMRAPDMAIPACRILAAEMPREMDNSLPEGLDHMSPILKKAGIDFGAAVVSKAS
jgi:hypothetical protein